MKIFISFFSLVFILGCQSNALANIYDLPKNGLRIIGEPLTHQVQKGDYFQKIAEDYNVGFLALLAANPQADPFLPQVNASLRIPQQMILPFTKHQGIVVNLAELRLYYFSPTSAQVHVFPIGIGREGLETPRTISFISDKRKDPVWRPTQEMKDRHFKKYGTHLADEIPAGKNNPFGKYALRIGHSEYLIHGTNQRFGIGMRASSGCIRMYDEDIKWLYDNVAVDTQVRIIDQPIKMSYEGGHKKYVEIHSPLSDTEPELYQASVEQLKRFIGSDLSEQALDNIVLQATGLVVKIK